jgi:chromosome transmission fidelity protein 1
LPSSLPEDLQGLSGEEELEERIKHLSLGSRKNLCINPRVAALGNPTAINERCLELQQPSTAAQHRCSFLPSKEDEMKVTSFRDHALATVKDIEDLGKLGTKMGLCPYYASRPVINHSEVGSFQPSISPQTNICTPDCNPSVSSAPPKISSRGPESLYKGPCHHYRRGT